MGGVSLSALEYATNQGLKAYEAATGGKVRFGEGVGESMRILSVDSISPYISGATDCFPVHYGEQLSTAHLTVLALAPGDGTGGPLLDPDQWFGVRPARVQLRPRSQTGVVGELFLPLATFPLDRPKADSILCAGNLALLGERRGTVIRLGDVGQRASYFGAMINRSKPGVPHVSAITMPARHNEQLDDEESRRRAVYNYHGRYFVVGGFIRALCIPSPDYAYTFNVFDALLRLQDGRKWSPPQGNGVLTRYRKALLANRVL